MVNVCTAYKLKVQKIEIFTVGESVTSPNRFVKGFTGLLFVCWLISWLVLRCSFIRQLFVRHVSLQIEIDADEHSRNCSVYLCVLGDFSNGKCPIRFAVKRTNVLSILCNSGHLSYRYTPMNVHPCFHTTVYVHFFAGWRMSKVAWSTMPHTKVWNRLTEHIQSKLFLFSNTASYLSSLKNEIST